MSRFGLRSASDSLKQLDEKPNRRKTCNPVSTSMKRNPQQKEMKLLTNIKDENLIDDIKIEIDESEKFPDITDGHLRNRNINDGDDDDEDDDGVADGDGTCMSPSPTSFKGALICSVPLERINDVIQKLNLSKSKSENNPIQKLLTEKEVDEIEESVDNDDDEEDDNNISKQSTSAIKNLCLYCDKKFSSHKMQLKHVEKFHCLQQDRRCSGRNSQMQQTLVPRKRKTTTGSQIFHGCTFCPKSKGQPQSVILPASDLNALFLHLAECHADKYFGCKQCVLRFQNITKLSKHMEVVHKSLPFAFDENSSKSRDNDTDSPMSNDKSSVVERSKLSVKRQHRSQKMTVGGNSNSALAFGANAVTAQSSTVITPNTLVIGAEEPILSRLGLTQNRLPNNRKGVRLRREKLIPELLLKSEQNHQTTSYANTVTTSSTLTPSTCSPKLRGKSIKTVTGFSGDVSSDVIFRVPTRNDILSCVFDDNFYKDVVSNVRNNLLFHLDGKIMGNSLESLDSAVMRHAPQPQIRSTLVKSPIVVTTMDSEIHAATSLSAVTAFPTLLTAEQFGGDANSSKIRRPHTKNSWKWKWDSVKKFKLVNEGGKIVKKMKHPMLGLRDLSKLDMWTQLTMRQKRESQAQKRNFGNEDYNWTSHNVETGSDPSREEKQRLNDQLNAILDMRLLPHIILEQNEQAIIKLENDEFGITPVQQATEDSGDNFMTQTFADEGFLSMLNLLPNTSSQSSRTKLVLSGEWARPRCYLCMCCGAKFEKLKSLEEHKMFRHSQILSTQYEVVGRELLNGNLLRHLFLPKKALSRYSNDLACNLVYTGAARRLFWHKNETIIREITNNDESSDSLQSMLNSCTTNSPSIKTSSSTEDCDLDNKIATATALGLMSNTTVVSPTHSIQSCSSTSSGLKSHMKVQSSSQSISVSSSSGSIYGNGCSKCGRKCNGILDLYRHMLDCSGDYVWSLAKKRKYRYYCGSKKRRPCNKHSILELRKNKCKPPIKTPVTTNESTEEGATTSANIAKPKTSPRPRPSDAESIKKMLENLPPKRVCKKIFPTLSKTKKNIKNIKPKLLAKHNIYNSLRKTRVRQMTSKILSKTKSQLKKSRKMTTRSSAVLSSKVSNKKINNKQKGIKRILDKTTKNKIVEKLSSNNKHEEYTDELVNAIKIETDKDMPTPFINDLNLKNKGTVVSTINPKKPVEDVDVLVPSNDNTEQISQVATTISNSVQTVTPSPMPSARSAESEASHSIVQVSPSPSVNIAPKDVSKMVTVSSNAVIVPAELERHVPNNKNIKRSKRISDCIAMLTGKLEQKLKTEQTVSVPTVSAKPINNIIPQASAQLVTQLPQTLPLQQKPLPKGTLDVPENMDVEKTAAKKKTPKRKTISRRIVKADVVEEKEIPVKAPELRVETPQVMTTPLVKPVNVDSLVRDPMPLARNVLPVTKQIVAPTNVKSKSSTTSDALFPQVEGQQTKTIAPPLLVPPMPSLVPLNNPHLIPKVPMYLPVENLCVPHMATLPLPLPIAVPAQVPAPVAVESVVHPHSTGTSGLGLIPPSPIPLITAVPPAHLTAPNTITLPASNFSITAASEPLNLSSSAKNAQKQSQDLSFSSRQKMGGMPARRQTICGFEARNFIMFDEMEPLDLSKKSRPEKSSPSPVLSLLPKSMEISPILLPAQNPLPLPNSSMGSIESSLMPVPPLTPEALLNKPFYSNLDLLRIPQVRNPVVGQAANNPEPTPPPPPPTIVVNNAPIPTPKAAAKKRNKSSTVTSVSNTSVGISECVVNSTNTPLKSHNTKEPANAITKKDTSMKGKVLLRMDEEVINHIDDAINSVINAVKASLDSEEAEKSQGLVTSTQSVIPKTTDDVNIPKESVGEFKYLTAARRNMRSKTLDCRPAALSKINVLNTSPLIEEKTQTQVMPGNPNESKSSKQIDSTLIADSINISAKCQNIPAQRKPSVEISEVPIITKQISDEAPIAKLTEIKSTGIPHEQITSMDNKISTENCLKVPSNNQNTNEVVETEPQALIGNNECPEISTLATVPEIDALTANPTVANSTNLDLEQMSNNNNTSSGFHSSAQSDQQTSVMSTTTSVSTSVMAPDTKKKQRRRRKNELAAIVADQLLESFKLDKARRDNLKKLENLAYEKSEDLLLTGMLLMSSTKRNVTSSSTGINNTFTAASIQVENNQNNNKRNNKSQPIVPNAEPSKHRDAVSIGVKVVDNPTVENDKTRMEGVEVSEGKKNNKRRQYRRRGKTLDNENISKLKSSLESFSIDIERQLTEYEAKNVNVFKSVSSNDVGKSQSNTKLPANTNPKTTVILRPSILSVTLEASVNSDNQPANKSSSTSDGNKTVVSSRDPRLNKNIHKEGEKNTDMMVEEKAPPVLSQKNSGAPEEIGDLEEDNYLTEIAKNVNEKIMSTENEEFAFKDDGFEMVNEMGMDDSNSKFSRPPTSMSVRSAPNFNDDRSNFGSICDENTNTEVMDMDLDDEMSVYTSYSQDLGRGRGRRRRRRRSILLTRKPKKRASSRDLSAEKIECILCKKVFYSANSLSKHNMTLAHVSKVSEQEYLLSKTLTSPIGNINQSQSHGTLGPYARRSTRRATISEPPMHLQSHNDDSLSPTPLPLPLPIATASFTDIPRRISNSTTTTPVPKAPIPVSTTQIQLPQMQTPFKPFVSQETLVAKKEELPQSDIMDTAKSSNTTHLPKDLQENEYDGANNSHAINTAFNGNSRLNLNPDERLFFECCNILKSAETPRISNVIVSEVAEECNNLNPNYTAYPFRQQEKSTTLGSGVCIRDRPNIVNITTDNTAKSSIHGVGLMTSNNIHPSHQHSMEPTTLFRDPQSINTSNCYNRSGLQDNRNARSPTYSAISHLSAVTNTTSRFKTKAAMKGYENVNIDLMQQQESKSRTICKLTELAEIALGNEDKPNSHSFSPIQSSNTPPRPANQPVPMCTAKMDAIAGDGSIRIKGLPASDYATILAVDIPKESNVQLPSRNERTKNNETRSSTSSKTIMHSSIIKAAVEEHQKIPSCNKIVIPDRPFKNIGLEEKETITFQKPKVPPVHLLTEDNSVSTGSFSDRDDYDFGSLSCEEEASVRESNDKHHKNNSSESSSESSRATAKTFENKSLIMGRIFKNVSTKKTAPSNITAVKLKSVGVQKDQTPNVRTDLNQLFDELRGNSGVDGHGTEKIGNNNNVVDRGSIIVGGSRLNHKQHQREMPKHIVPASSPPAVVSSTTVTPSTNVRKNKSRESRGKIKTTSKTPKDISKLQSELGMSPDEIKKLIDEGQRKSKRRCATNRPKKLIEMWSSDEYEEFLSTKDIIALIEEKEQEEKRKKRKNSINMSSNNSEMAKEKDTSDVTSSTKEPKRRNTRKGNIVEPQESLIPEQGNFEAKLSKGKKAGIGRKEDPVSTTVTPAEPSKTSSRKNSGKSTIIDNVTTKPKRATNNKKKAEPAPKVKQAKSKKESTKSKNKKQTVDNEKDDYDEDNENNDVCGDDDDDFLIDLKHKQPKKTRANKATSSKPTACSTATVSSTANVKLSKSSAASQSARKRSSNNNTDISISSNIPTATEASKAPKQQPPKNKRKNQANQSPPRRKRPATEKLYYWSSSSDEEFGRINNKKMNPPADNFEGGGEQYQKHGWIVGDSHKKLVTLLAIAKGNKKVDSNCGVKKNVTKKRN